MEIIILIIVVVCGIPFANFANWAITKSRRPPKTGLEESGFLPYGFTGVFKGAGKCFFAFVGFDEISVAGEEVVDPKKSVPRAIISTLVINCVIFVSVSAMLTLLVPYYEIVSFF